MKFRNLTALAVVLSAFSFSGMVNAGTINFTGAVQDVSCNVKPGTGASGSDDNITIDLGTVSKDGIANNAETVTGMATTFASIDVTCADVKSLNKVKMKFDGYSGSGVESNRGLLHVTGHGTADNADGVGIAILDDNNKVIDLRDSAKFIEADLTKNGNDATAKLNFKAAYMMIGNKADIIAGKAHGQLPFVLIYE